MTVYFIGGASASGKSTTAAQLGLDYSIRIIKLDDIYNVLVKAAGETEAKQMIRPMSFACANELMESNEPFIVEGGWISVEQAVLLHNGNSAAFRAVYCGYPNAKAADRFSQMADQQGSEEYKAHWTTDESKDYDAMIAWITKQIAQSASYRKKSEASGFLFVDFTTFQDGALALKIDFERWLASTCHSLPSRNDKSF